MCDHLPTLPQALVHKVLAFYLENPTEVDAYICQSRQVLDRETDQPQPGPDAAELRRRFERGPVSGRLFH